MRILITGASGLIGTALIERLREGNELFCLSRQQRAGEPGVTWLNYDRKASAVPSFPEVDVVYDLAGQTSVYSARDNPLADLDANVVRFVELLESLRRQKRQPFVVLAGTATEAGLGGAEPLDETHPDEPVTFYDISKLAAENYLKQYVREGWLRGCTLRLANVYGRTASGQKRDRGIIDKVFTQASAGEEVRIFGDGEGLRDYVFIEDVAAAFVLAAEKSERTNGRTFYIGTGRSLKLKEAFAKVAARAEAVTGKRTKLINVEPPASLSPIEGRSVTIDSSAFRAATGWAPAYDFDAGLRRSYPDGSNKSDG